MGTSNGDEEEGADHPAHLLSWSNLLTKCQHMFMTYLSKKDPKTKCSSLRGLCGVFLARPRQMLLMDGEGLVSDVMSGESHPTLQIEALKCWCEVLIVSHCTI